MVLSEKFQDIFEASSKFSTLSLPKFKQIQLKIQYDDPSTAGKLDYSPKLLMPFANSAVIDIPVYSCGYKRLTAAGPRCKDVFEMSFDVTGSNLNFRPGDTIGIIPVNESSEVDFIISHLDLHEMADAQYFLSVDKSVQNGKMPPHVPMTSTLRYALKHCFELRSVLKKLFILALLEHTKDHNERKVLEYLCSKEGSEAYRTHILNDNICILDIFRMLKSCKPPIEVLFANLPRLLPRPYSIVNSSLKDPNIIKICFSVINIGNNRSGLVSGWLRDIIYTETELIEKWNNLTITDKIGNRLRIYLRMNMSGFQIPEDLGTPLIMIGPGTGVSPFIGFLEEREMASLINPQLKLGEAWLFFGCRRPDLDFIYKEELTDFESKGLLNKLCTAYSRLAGAECKYVQDAILKEGKEVTRLIENGASIFVCGDVKTMASQIRETIVKCLVESGQSPKDAEEVMSDLQKNKRYLVDAWN